MEKAGAWLPLARRARRGMIQPARVHERNSQPVQPGKYVLYWMQQTQRAEWNHALEYAVTEANARGLPPVAVFGLTDGFPEANLRHYQFMLEGLAETRAALKRRGIPLVVMKGDPPDAALTMAGDAALLVMDGGYLRIQRQWRERVAASAPCRVIEVESDVAVPVDTASGKEEYAARTFRPKLERLLEEYLVPVAPVPVEHPWRRRETLPPGLSVTDPCAVLRDLDIDRAVGPGRFTGGAKAARVLLDRFVNEKLERYAADRNDPNLDGVSHMSPYLHFGQISPIEIALTARGSGVGEGLRAYFEELLVRRELSVNFVWRNAAYDKYGGLPEWARAALDEHRRDPREYLYTRDQWEDAATHDPYWNAAQKEMARTGKMHNYMRMYWGKKILEWSESPEEAFETTLYLNNKYELDGRDANSFAGVAWCFGKHDRPWARRPVFGTVRYMNANGLKRKFDADAYVRAQETESG